ncbi:non-heme iron oxygenase ferredoxin subunit [Tianweitania sp.]|uniref:Rieske (2Fe-2S) protein n=1 Tax=Tianweitania sp. TaxID=2021634 RepID=UPI00289A2CD4|nr:non-heme iron oxygenase ferredoxin subunit [Tianweitania sp.]
MGWNAVCRTEELDEGAMRSFELEGTRIVLYRIEGACYATSNVCTHAFALLSDGWLDDNVIECPLHGAQFDVTTGRVLCGPATVDLAAYPVREKDGFVEVEVAA